MLRRAKQFIKDKSTKIDRINNLYEALNNDLKNPKNNLGQIQTELNNNKKSISSLHEVEFRVYSQWGDDGIIQYLIHHLDIPHKTFIEFGVENYKESNTRFLLINNNWSGYIIDGSEDNIKYIKNDIVAWRFDLHSKAAFITRENINALLSEFIQKGYNKEIGILSIDIDGNDYWVWKEIDVVNPVIVITEYNAVFGPTNTWSVPYKPDFYRLSEHTSYQYWGASLTAFCKLADQKGYYFVGCNSNGNNAYFVRKDKIGSFKPLNPTEGFVDSKFREDADKDGNPVFGKQRIELIRGMKIQNTETNNIEII